MSAPARVRIDQTGLFLKGVGGSSPAVLIHFDDVHIWSFTPGADGAQTLGGTQIGWPHVLVPYLEGVVQIRVTSVDGEVIGDQEHHFGTATTRVAFVDKTGHPYAIDKMGHLTHSFDSTPDEIKAEILVGTQAVIGELRERCGVEAWLGYGALLGAVREGGMIGHDSDTDICYFSEHTAPADIIRETYLIERLLKGLGWDVLRMSGGDLKVIWPLSDGRNCHIDIFSSFFVGELYYLLGEHGEQYAREDLLPLSTVTLDGYEFPAPANPEAMLVYLYGESWRVPDPAFTPSIDPVVMGRLDGWLRGFREHMGDWTVTLRGTSGKRSPVPTTGSDFAAWVNGQIAPDARVLDLGAGNGRDGIWFAGQGHAVRSADYSRRSAVESRNLKAATGARKFLPRQVILNETRHVFQLIGVLARTPHHIYARQLVGCLDEAARENLFRIGATTLRRISPNGPYAMWLEFSAAAPGAPEPAPAGLVKRLDPDVLIAEITASGGSVDYLEIAQGVDMFDNQDPAVARMRVTWPVQSQQKETS